jgi:integrase
MGVVWTQNGSLPQGGVSERGRPRSRDSPGNNGAIRPEPDLSRPQEDWHRETTEALRLAEHLRVHAARHHWAVLALRGGVPVRVVQTQLGHASPTLTLGLYGAFIPGAEEQRRASHTGEERKTGEV